jgi:hypothetical protein
MVFPEDESIFSSVGVIAFTAPQHVKPQLLVEMTSSTIG